MTGTSNWRGPNNNGHTSNSRRGRKVIPTRVFSQFRDLLETNYSGTHSIITEKTLANLWEGNFKPQWLRTSKQITNLMEDMGVSASRSSKGELWVITYLPGCILTLQDDGRYQPLYEQSQQAVFQAENEVFALQMKQTELERKIVDLSNTTEMGSLKAQLAEAVKNLTLSEMRLKEMEGGGELPDFPDYVPPKCYLQVRRSLEAGLNVFLRGPTGCGKTTLCKHLAQGLGVPFWFNNFNGETTYESFVGTMTLKDGETKWQRGTLHEWFESPKGGLYLADEVDFMPPFIASALHPVLERPRRMTISQYQADPFSPALPDKAFFVAAANTFGRGDDSGLYQGTVRQNAAYLRRFGAVFTLDYTEAEEDILVSKGLDRAFASALINFAKVVRKGNLVHTTFCTQTLLDVTALCKIMSRKDALEVGFLNRLAEDEKVCVKKEAYYRNLSRGF